MFSNTTLFLLKTLAGSSVRYCSSSETLLFPRETERRASLRSALAALPQEAFGHIIQFWRSARDSSTERKDIPSPNISRRRDMLDDALNLKCKV